MRFRHALGSKTYGGGGFEENTWAYGPDFAFWASQGYAAPDLDAIALTSKHSGRFWLRADTKVGQLGGPPVQAQRTGTHFKTDGSPGEQLANHYQDGFPVVATFEIGAVDGPYAWLDEATRARYREVWSMGLHGGCNYYRASPLKPPLDASSAIHGIEIPHEALTVKLPTQVIWGMQDVALPPRLIEGLEAYIPDLRIHRIEDATHWILHEQPALVQRLLADFLA